MPRTRHRRRGRALYVLGASVISLACGSRPSDDADLDPPKLVSELEPGLRLLTAERASEYAHLVELVVHEGYVYVANSLGVVTMRLDGDGGGLTMTDDGEAAAGMWTSCNSLAIHPATDTLYCGTDRPSMGDPRVEIYDLSDPAAPVRRAPLELEAWAVRDVEVVGDTLLINQFDDGLWTASIDEQGDLSALTQASVEGNVRFTVAVGGRLLSALADIEGRGTRLRVLDPDTFAELDGEEDGAVVGLELDGPPLGLSADDFGAASVIVALGSGGAAVVDLVESGGSGEPASLELRHLLEPTAVVSHALLAGEVAVALTLSGAFAWDLEEPDGSAPRLFGFGPESAGAASRDGGMLHGAWYEGELLTSDWTWVERWALAPDGEVLALDIPRGVYVQPSGPVRWRLRNPGSVPLRAEHWAGDRHLFDVELGPNSVEQVELGESERELLLGEGEPALTLGLRVHDPSVDEQGQPVSTSSMMILQREPGDPLPPAVGEQLPEALTLADVDGQVFTLPLDHPVSLVWYTPDCALMWPELEDLAWQARVGIDSGRGAPMYVTASEISETFTERWGLDAVAYGQFGPEAPPEVDEANAAFGGQDLLDVFVIYELPGNSQTSDYLIDASGTVLSIERMYRGRWSLAEPAPWW